MHIVQIWKDTVITIYSKETARPLQFHKAPSGTIEFELFNVKYELEL